eukprot:scaffold135456_cov18-Tisochrysis_lutea.AAC.1
MGLWGLAQALQHQQQLCTTKASTDTGPSSSSSSRSRNDDVSQTMSQVGSSNSAFAATFATPSPSHPHPTTAASPLSLQQVVLGACNGGWGAAFAASARAQLQRFSGSELAMLLSSLAALRSPPAAALHAPAKGPPTEPLHGDLQGAPSTSPFTTHATLYPPSMCTSETGTKETTPARVKPTQADSEENSGSPSTDLGHRAGGAASLQSHQPGSHAAGGSRQARSHTAGGYAAAPPLEGQPPPFPRATCSACHCASSMLSLRIIIIIICWGTSRSRVLGGIPKRRTALLWAAPSH